MLDNLTGEDIASEVKLFRDSFSGTILIVEGESDSLLFSRFIDTSQCQIILSHGKENSILAIEILDVEDSEGFLAIVDADFWNLDGCPILSTNLIVTDFHDSETMILQSNAFYSVLPELGSTSKITRFLSSCGSSDIRLIIFSRALPIGTLRRISSRNNLNLKFEGLPYKKIINKESLEVDIGKLVASVLSLSPYTEINAGTLLRDLQVELAQPTPDFSQVCCGHDVIAIICIGLKKSIGNQQSKAVLQRNIEAIFRLAYDSSYFRSTQLYADSKTWETRNQPYCVFCI